MPQLIDLSLPLAPGMRGVAVAPKCSLERDGWNAAEWHLYSHCGTHMDAAIHFGINHGTISDTQLQACCGPAHVVNLAPIEPRALISIASLKDVEQRSKPGDSLLLRTDWYRHAGAPEIYRDALPRISIELAEWCVARRIRLLGVEPPSVADVNDRSEVARVHQILLEGNVTIVEGLANLDRLRQPRVFFAALPLKLAGGDGSPVRAFAVEGVSPDCWS